MGHNGSAHHGIATSDPARNYKVYHTYYQWVGFILFFQVSWYQIRWHWYCKRDYGSEMATKVPPLEINIGAPWDPILQNVILKPIKIWSYAKNQVHTKKSNNRDLKILRFWYFISHWPTKNTRPGKNSNFSCILAVPSKSYCKMWWII